MEQVMMETNLAMRFRENMVTESGQISQASETTQAGARATCE
jgi:hypothetical protein